MQRARKVVGLVKKGKQLESICRGLEGKEGTGGDGATGCDGWVGSWDHGRRETFHERRGKAAEAAAVGMNWGGAEYRQVINGYLCILLLHIYAAWYHDLQATVRSMGSLLSRRPIHTTRIPPQSASHSRSLVCDLCLILIHLYGCRYGRYVHASC